MIRELDDPAGEKIVASAQGSHLVLPPEFLQSKAALMVPKTSDGRVLFAIPWHDRLIIGTTDFGVPKPVEEPKIQEHEINFILSEAARYMAKDPTEGDVLACYSGLRPLVKAGAGKKTAALSRSHFVLVSPSGLVTITGGKWTTYRHMGEDCINHVAEVAGLQPRPSKTAELSIHGNSSAPETFNAPEHLAVYGTDRKAVEQLAGGDPNKADKLHPRIPYLTAEVYWAVEHEMARTVEDVLSRRTRALLLDAKAAIEVAPRVAAILADKLKRDKKWVADQISTFTEVARNYLLRA